MQGKTEMQNACLNHGPTRPWRAPARSRGCGGTDRRASALTSQPAEASESVKHVDVWPGGQRGCREGSPSGSNLAAVAVPAFPSARL